MTKKESNLVERVLGVENVKVVPDLDTFVRGIMPGVLELWIAAAGGKTQGEINTEQFTNFMALMYAAAELMTDWENWLAVAHKTESFFKHSRRRCALATAKVKNSLKYLADADRILTEEQKELVPGVLRFRECGDELQLLYKSIRELEGDNAAALNPCLRNARERHVASRSMFHFPHPYPATPKSQRVRDDIVKLIDEPIAKYVQGLGITIPSCRIDRFIGVFLVVMGAATSEANIRRIRRQNRAQVNARPIKQAS